MSEYQASPRSSCVSRDINGATYSETCCSQTSENISYTCENISTVSGFRLSVPESLPPKCLEECEHGWYTKNNTFLVDSKETCGNLSELIVKVTPWNVTTHTCLDGAYWKMDCPCSGKNNLVVSYEAVESPKPVGKDVEEGSYNGKLLHLLWLLLCIPVFAVLIWNCKEKAKEQNHWYSSVVNGVLSLR
ncbi:uncharacterized protein LOC131369601 isoform X2 [Hemibagrus wyckioides]|uniref:uncharacterized protein LOC131369601 isoform X2 n=1 Tax=Hemibagrus wyckioides TaxID=337641 RepID=UPI00266DB46C|nr:uncharacterized protein LOC131369601 isoform X2 [Hemibagrus wyckioides]